MKKFIAAALAAFLLLPALTVPAYAGGGEPEDTAGYGAEYEEYGADEYPFDYPYDVTDEYSEAVTLPTRPPGTSTVIDYNTDPQGRLFYTIMTPDEHVFYLVIDMTSNTENVYFLNAVTIADLAALAEIPIPPQNGAFIPAPPVTEQPPEETLPPEAEPEQGGGMGTIIFIIVIAVLGGGAGWYFKVYRPKQQGAADADEYDPSAMADTDTDYAEDWGEDTADYDGDGDNPPWDDESGDER